MPPRALAHLITNKKYRYVQPETGPEQPPPISGADGVATYKTQTREHLFKCCPEWKSQRKILWVEVRKETETGGARFASKPETSSQTSGAGAERRRRAPKLKNRGHSLFLPAYPPS